MVAALLEPSLYSEQDNIRALDNSSLELQLLQSPKCALVEFINYFCGDCRRYAPSFKRLAAQLYNWQRVIEVYAVDCAQERNVRICREFNISSTPTLRFYAPHFQRSEQQLGVAISSLQTESILQQLTELLANITYTHASQPNFAPISSVEAAQALLSSCQTEQLALVHSSVAKRIILELLPWSMLSVRALAQPQLFDSLGLDGNQTKLCIVNCAGQAAALPLANNSVAAYLASISDLLRARGFAPLPALPLSNSSAHSSDEFYLNAEQSALLAHVLHSPPRVYRADLEQAIDKLLHIELPKVRLFQGDSLLALQRLLHLLQLHNPLNRSGKLLLQQLHAFVSCHNASSELSGLALQLRVLQLQQQLPKIFKAQRYVGCVASQPLLRGFTCALWTLFHYLSVQSARAQTLPGGVFLASVHGFVKHFFGCSNCVQHFLAMAERRQLFAVRQRDAEVLWLWQAHNEINQRLAGDSTEDPKFPKQQFPSYSECSNCRESKSQNASWLPSQVLAFLQDFYSEQKLSNYGLPTTNGYD
ncbi:sulfhydryl oxidase 1 [Drosophila busckii]|uniref:sulfhydryl oxidase 1 n=1 Tax=Drosophila busckii TaxID=30019 RepID=UPI00083EFEFC|nr:sulfhydryl oxidase 1 [Drosophila busckii]